MLMGDSTSRTSELPVGVEMASLAWPITWAPISSALVTAAETMSVISRMRGRLVSNALASILVVVLEIPHRAPSPVTPALSSFRAAA